MTAFRALLAAAAVAAAGSSALAAAPVGVTITPAPAKLTLENATPLPVPPRPSLGTPQPVKAPPRFVSPKPMDAPPLPELVEGPFRPAPRGPQAQTQTSVATSSQGVGTANPTPAAPVPAPPSTVTTRLSDQASPAAPLPPRTETASLPPPPAAAPPAATAPPSGVLSLAFDGVATNLPDTAEIMVDRIVQRLRASDTARLQLRSYASGTAETAREARQLSLARALSLRERLTAFGIRSSRIDVRALGVESGANIPDRIDIEFLNE